MSVILIVVGASELRKRFGDMLQASEHHLVFANSVDDGALRYAESKPHLVLCSHSDEGIDGTVLIQRLKVAGSVSPVVLMSSEFQPNQQSELRASSLGASGYLQLPFTKVSLAEAISQHLSVTKHGPTSTPHFVRQAISDNTELNFEAAVEEFLEHVNEPDGRSEGDTQIALNALTSIDRADTDVPPEPEVLITDAAPIPSLDPIAEPEIDRTEATPSAVRRSKVEAVAAGKRRALDESQLGKRLAKRIRRTFDSLENATDLEILGLELDSNAEAIDAAYFELSLEFHPDRFFLLSAGDLKEKIYAIFRRISRAYETLSEGPPVPRTADVEKPTADIPSSESARRQAEPFVKRAKRAIERGELHQARMFYAIACAYEPGDEVLSASLRSVTEQEQLRATEMSRG